MKMKILLTTFMFMTFHHSLADTKKPMAKSFKSLVSLVPYLADGKQFHLKSNEKFITDQLTEINQSFQTVKHEKLIQQDLFAPSYELVKQNIDDSLKAFASGKKDYAHWRLKELTSLCIDCHTRLPSDQPSRFDSGEQTFDSTRFENSYNLGVGQLIVRRYFEAKQSFTKSIDEKIVKGETKDLIKPLKQILLIETKILKQPKEMTTIIKYYLNKKQIPDSVKKILAKWQKQLQHWETKNNLFNELSNDVQMKNFIQSTISPLKEKSNFENEYDIDHLLISGVLSNFLYKNPKSELAAEINYWIGLSEKYLKREHFFGSGDLFFKQCVQRYPENPIASKCLEEYKESVEFEFSGSSGTHIPSEIKKELEDMKNRLKLKMNKT